MNKLKSTRLHIAARLVGFIGVLACLLGAGVYFLLCLPEVCNLPFEPLYLIPVGIALVIFVLVSILLHAIAVRCEEEEFVEETADAPAPEEAPAEEAAEAEETAEEQPVEEEPAEEKNKVLDTIREKLPEGARDKFDQATDYVQKNKKIILPIAAACVATLIVSNGIIRKNKERNRKEFYRWLG